MQVSLANGRSVKRTEMAGREDRLSESGCRWGYGKAADQAEVLPDSKPPMKTAVGGKQEVEYSVDERNQ